MKNLRLLSISIVVLLVGCGGGTDIDIGDTTDTGDTNIGPDVQIPFTCSDVETFDVGGGSTTATFQSGTDGDIIYDCLFENADSKYTLDTGIPSINIIDVSKTESVDITCTDGANAKGTTIYDYKNGVVTSTGTLNGQSMTCQSRFTEILPATLTDHDSFATLLEDWGTDTDRNSGAQSGLLNTNCPQVDGINPLVSICKGFFAENYTITDESGKEHKISIKASYNQQPDKIFLDVIIHCAKHQQVPQLPLFLLEPDLQSYQSLWL